MVQNCTLGILPNPDIAGVGVRVSIYAQAYLSLIHPILAGLDGRLTTDEIASLHSMYFGILLTACALLISAFIQATTYGLSVYHAVIVLNLSWINCASAAVLPIYVLQNHVMDTRMSFHAKLNMLSPIEMSSRFLYHEVGAKIKPILVVCVLASAHLCVMAGLGIWVWKGTDTFGDQPGCTPFTFITLFFHDVPVNHRNLRHTSIIIYSIAAVPGFNIYVFICLVLGGLAVLLVSLVPALLLVILAIIFLILLLRFCGLKEQISKSVNRNSRQTHEEIAVKTLQFMAIPMVIALLQTYFVVCTELMIKRSKKIVAAGESQWTFGQTLAVLLTIMPLIEVYKALREAKEFWWGEKGQLLSLGTCASGSPKSFV